MGKTLAYLGPKPLIELQTAGLKVGQIMNSYRKMGFSFEKIIEKASIHDICQSINRGKEKNE